MKTYQEKKHVVRYSTDGMEREREYILKSDADTFATSVNGSVHEKICCEEINIDEVWVGNTGLEIPQYLSRLKTARLGKIAYDIHGKPLAEHENCRPLIIHKSEANEYNRIMMARMKE